jgi:enamine deaminase RidA (YjgF/YER057c/UK114 family)
VVTVRRFRGPIADHIFLLCQPAGGSASAARQAEDLYEALRAALAAEGTAPDALVTETLFFRDVRDGVPTARAARARVLGDAGVRPATTVVGQPPLEPAADVALAALTVVPRSPDSWSFAEIDLGTACTCESCASGVRAKALRLPGQTSLWTGDVHGCGRDAFEEAYDMFRVAERLLAGAGMRFTDVVRTWIHVRDIDRDYDALNRARTAFFRDRGVGRRPASTGVQGIPFPDRHHFALSLHATTSDHPLGIRPMSTPSMNEAWTYGADFSRGLRIGDTNQATLYVSGTASVDEAGRTVHVGDFAAQAERMLQNIASLLERQGAGFRDVVSGVTYVKRASDAHALQALCRARGFDGFPSVIVEAPLCRPDLLCETEAVAVLSLKTAEA